MGRKKRQRGHNFTPKIMEWTLGQKSLLVQARRQRLVRSPLVVKWPMSQ